MGKQWKQQDLGFRITAYGDCSHKIKRCLLLGRKVMTKLDSILKANISLSTKVRMVKAMAFSVVMYGCESWTVKKAERQRIDAFELWCWRRLLRVPWTARRSSQSSLKEFNPKYSLEKLILKLKFQYFGHLLWRTDSFEKTLILGKIEGRRRSRRPRMRWLEWYHWLNGHVFKQAPGDGEGQGKPGVLQSMGSQRARHDWTELNWCLFFEKYLFRSLTTFWLGCLFFWYCVVWADYIFWEWTLCWLFHLLRCYFLPFRVLHFHSVYSFLCCVKAFKFN